MNQVPINSQLMRWARQRASLTVDDLARKLHLKPERINQWENGEAQPSWAQAQNLARALHIPFGYLFLSQPPQTVLPTIADFRTMPGPMAGRFSPELEDALNDALRKRDWLRERRISEGMSPLPFVGRFTINAPISQVAADIRRYLNLPTPPADGLKSWRDHLQRLVTHAEEAGIVVLQSGVALGDNRRPLSVEEMRGFTLADEYAPVIFINTRDSIAARIFTLAHELAHLWSGTSGVSNPIPGDTPEMPAVERFCNRVAGELLVPSESLLTAWQQHEQMDRRSSQLEERAQALAQMFRVSVFVVLIRAYESGLISRSDFDAAYKQAQQAISPPEPEGGGGGDFYRTLRSRNGRMFVNEVLLALRQGEALYREAAALLNVRVGTLEKALEHE
jgi:Zn-dependent peptidase ImmA (M78 family)/DNA-binding XRE family transcriptional regulator